MGYLGNPEDKTVHAYAIDETHIYIKCKKCKFHRHGSCGHLLNRKEDRSGHCPYYKYDVVVIDDDTIRGEIGKSRKILKRTLPKYQVMYEIQQMKANDINVNNL